MEYFYLFLTVFFISFQNIARKFYSVRSKSYSPYFYSLTLTVFAMLFFLVVSGFKLEFDKRVIPYSVGFAASYGAALAGSAMAIATGPLSLTLLINSYSLLIPAMYGVIALGETMSIYAIVGLLLLLISLLLINIEKESRKLSIKWILWVGISFIGNGMCSLVQKLHQLKFVGAYKNEFMIYALIISALGLSVASLIKKEKPLSEWKLHIIYGGSSGIANGIVNLLVMITTGMIASSVLYPSISAGGITIGLFAAIFIFKEKLTKKQLFGYTLGILSVILLNL